MSELTLESLAERIAAIERTIAEKSKPSDDWRSVVGILAGSESAKQMLAEATAMREAERVAAREGRAE